MNPDLLGLVRCPICRGSLVAVEPGAGAVAGPGAAAAAAAAPAPGTGAGIHCRRCAKTWPVEDGVPFFFEGPYEFRAAAPADTAALVGAAARGEGEQEVGALFPARERAAWFLDASRADGVLLTPFHPERTVALEVGAGFGGVALPLSRLVSRAVAVDASADGVRFIAGRARTEGRPNLHPMTADALRLPFADDSFDLVILNGCLEWIPVSHPDRLPEEVQSAALKEAARVLREGGTLYLAIENRFGAKYLLGAKDEHTGLRFVTVLPRPLGDLVSRAWRRGRPYREHTQSAGRLARWLREAGVTLGATYAPLRDYRVFRFLVDCDTPKALSLLVRRSMPFPTRASRVFLAAARIGLALKLPLSGSPTLRTALFPSIALVGRKGHAAGAGAAADSGKAEGWIDRAIHEDFGAAAGRLRLVVSSKRSATVFVFAQGGREPVGVARVQRFGAERAWVRNEHEFLKLISGLADAAVADSVPHPIRLREAGGVTLATQEFVSGEPLRAGRGEAAMAGLTALGKWLAVLGRATARPAPEGGSLADALGGPIGRIGREVEVRERLIRARWAGILGDASELPAPPLVVCHFDLCPSNVVVRNGAVRVVDWEYARWSWAPYDWFRFVCRFALDAAQVHLDMRAPITRDGRLLHALKLAFYRPGPLAECVRGQTIEFLAASGFPEGAASSIFVLAILEYLLLQVPLKRTDRLVSLLFRERNIFDGTGV